MSLCNEFADLVAPLVPSVTPLTDDACVLVMPVDGLDSHPIHLYVSRDGSGWNLTDGGHLVSDLSAYGVADDRIQAKLNSLAGDMPISLRGDDVSVWLPGDDERLARKILTRATSVILGVWMLRTDQPLPAEKTQVSARLARTIREVRPDAVVRESVVIPGASRLDRRFDLQVGPQRRQGFHLVRTADTQNRTQLHHSAELYLVYADDLRRLPSYGDQWRFFFVWNDAAAELDSRVYSELDNEQIRPMPASGIEQAAETILETVSA